MDDIGPGLIIIIVILQIVGALFGSKKKKEKQDQQDAETTSPTYSEPGNTTTKKSHKEEEHDPLRDFLENIANKAQPESIEPIPEYYGESDSTLLNTTESEDTYDDIDQEDKDDEEDYDVDGDYVIKPRPLEDKTHLSLFYSGSSCPERFHLNLTSRESLQQAIVLTEIFGPCKANQKKS